MMKKDFKIFASGRSMVEMIGVLSIVGFLTLGGIWGFDQAARKLRVNDLKDEISTLIANIRSMFFKLDDYAGLSPYVLIHSGFVPERMISEDQTKILNANQGEVTIAPAQTTVDDNGAFILIYNGLNSYQCRELVTANWGSDIQSGFLGITIKKDGDLTPETSNLLKATIETSESTIGPKDMPNLTVEQAYVLCDCGSASTCAIAWKFL